MTSFVITLLSLLLSRAAAPESSRRRGARLTLPRPWRGRIGARARPRLEALEDRTLLSPYLVTTTADSGPGSLRDAITQINADTSHTLYPSPGNPSVDEIDFAVTAASDTGGGFNAGTGVATIAPQTYLPQITTAVFINGYTEPGASPNTLSVGDNAVLKVQLALNALPSGTQGLKLHANGSTIRGLVINGANSGVGAMSLNASDYVTPNNYHVEGNFIGTDVSGTSVGGGGPGFVGIDMVADYCTIGGTSPDTRNIIAGWGSGIGDRGLGTLIEGNYIGTNASGTNALGNITGVTAAYPHTIVGNLISGNQVGISGPGNNSQYPASIFQVQGNLIGTDATGMHGIPNGTGILLSGAGNALIGGTTAAARNVISGNSGDGVYVGAGGMVIQGNYIGTDISGMTALGNGTNGIEIQSNNNLIGGTTPGAGNTIAFNGGNGVSVYSGIGNSILSNSIHDNAGLGIRLATGANDNQTAPVLTSASTSAGSTTISGTLQSVASTTFRIEFFANTTADPSSYGQGRTFLGYVNVTTNSSGTGSFTVTLTTPLPAGQTILSATATNQTTNDTSQFARDVSIPVVGAITAPLAPVAVNTAVNASASFTDAIPSTTHTAVWNWGDSNTSTGTVTESSGSGTVTGSHTYTVDGVYTVTLTVTNSLGGSGQSVFQYVVVYNQEAGFVTGSGWITSPAGAYAANATLTGRATFGFNARYRDGATVPHGDTAFDFPAAHLHFESTSYDWLVMTTNQGQFQGSGQINEAGNYGFLVTGLDQDGGPLPDKFRIKIWDKNNNNAVVYDTQPGAATTAAPTTALGGGRIQVHTNAQLVAGGANPSGENVAPLTLEELQPVVQEAIARWEAAGIDAAQVSVLSQVTVGIAAFSGPWLGMAFPGAIWIDQTAAGYGWYIAPNPVDDSAFPAAPGSPAYGKVDLITVVEHELGHELGFEDTTGDDLMGVFLPTGVRRLPALDQAPVNTPDEGFVPPANSPPLAILPARGAVVGSDVLAALVETPLDKGGSVSTVTFAPPTGAPVLPSLAPVLLTVENHRGDGTAPTSSGQQEANLVWALDAVFASNQDLLSPELT
jgi:hypothetical protein